MNLNYRRQLILTVILVLVGNVLCTLLHHWIYRNIAFFICGMLWIFHPVMAGTQEPTKKAVEPDPFLGWRNPDSDGTLYKKLCMLKKREAYTSRFQAVHKVIFMTGNDRECRGGHWPSVMFAKK